MPLRNQFASESEWLEHLRCYFAAKAMQGFCAAADPLKVAELREDIAACAYEQADAMLAAREQQP